MTVQVGDVIRCAVRQDLQGVDYINVFEFQHQGTTPVSEADIMTAVASYFDGAYSHITSRVTASMAPVDIKVDVVDVLSGIKRVVGNVGLVLWGSAYAPSNANERTPNGIAVMLKFLTDVGKIFGKKFIGGFTEQDIVNNGMVSTLTTALTSMVTTLLTNLVVATTEDFVPGVLSTNQNHMGEFHAFNSGDVPTQVAYQRRRKPGVGS